jgi:predicted transcriptional regulator YheO
VDTSLYTRLSDEILLLAGLSSAPVKGEAVGERLFEDMEGAINTVLEELGQGGKTKFTQDERLTAVERFMERGVFLLRGSISTAAEKLHCSEASIYRYIGTINKRKGKSS